MPSTRAREEGIAPPVAALLAVARVGAWVCGALLVAVSMLVLAEVIGRNFLGSRLHGAEEIAGYVFAISVAWGLGLCVLERSHIRLDFLYALLGERLRRVLDVASALSLLAFAVFLARQGWLTFVETWEFSSASTTSLHVPLWVPQLAWCAGLCYFALACLAVSLHVVVALARGRWGAIERIAGIPGADR